MKRKRVLVFVAIVVLVLFGGFVLADGVSWQSEGTVVWDAPDGPEVITLESLQGTTQYPIGSNTIDFGHTTFSSDNPTEVTATGLDTDEITLDELDVSEQLTVESTTLQTMAVEGSDLDSVTYSDIDLDSAETEIVIEGDGTIWVHDLPENSHVIVLGATNRSVSTDSSGVAEISVDDESITLIDTTGPELSGPSPVGGDVISAPPAVLEITVEDDDWAHVSDPTTITWFVNDTQIDQDTISQPGTYSTQIDAVAGSNTWRVEVEDDYGNTVESGPHEFGIPNELEIRDYDTNELIDNTDNEVEIRFFEEGDEITETRTTTDGVIDMTGLPGNVEYIITVRADDYETQRVVLPNIIDQQTIWMFDETEDLVFVEYVLQDETARFPNADTKLIIEAPMPDDAENDESESYQAISGDYFGAGAAFEAPLFRGERYRLVVENRDGDRRTIGSYVAESSRSVTLEIGQIEWLQPDDDSYNINISVQEVGETESIVVQYFDPAETTDVLSIRVENRYDSEEVIWEETVYSTDEYQATIPLTEEQQPEQWAVNYTIERNPRTHGYIPIGGDHLLGIPLPTHWLSAFGMIFIVIIAAAYPGRLAGVGGIVVVSMTGAGMLVGILHLPVGMWFVAATIAVLGLIIPTHEQGGL